MRIVIKGIDTKKSEWKDKLENIHSVTFDGSIYLMQFNAGVALAKGDKVIITISSKRLTRIFKRVIQELEERTDEKEVKKL